MKLFVRNESSSRKSQLKILLRMALFAGFALWIFGGLVYTYDLYRYFGAAHWPQSPAVITQSTISVYNQNIRYCSKPEIRYQYAFSGQTLTSTTWGFAFFNCSSPQFASQITGKYKTGDKVIAYVNPVSSIAVLEPDLTAL